ncbi:GntR family transcriptional regulator [Paenibacillus sp. GCM10012307]|uniref:GntR family transcriptional regulator n=1 Tax=Paenibacillus roseus TaxID=2798579 RepID=A0A934J6F3_9BACL|nr:GntR family transcriptional regulator [Paenibacillus roseus]MBJ6362463.1 GntR family transcriptional regulator [Paenibacillus roseus]
MQAERQPLYMQIYLYFKDLIAQEKLKENDKIPSEKELMERFDVSRITVTNALVQLAKDGWIYRVPGRGSFVSKGIEQILTGQTGIIDAEPRIAYTPSQSIAVANDFVSDVEAPASFRSIGLLLPGLVDNFGLRLIQGIQSALAGTDYRLHIILTDNSIEQEKEAIRRMIHNRVDGLIIFPCDAEVYNDEILSLKALKYPFVLVDRYLPGIETNVVRSDGMVGGKMAVDYLWELGHRDIAICSDSVLPTITVEDRINGYMEAMKRRGAMINPALILTDFNVDYSKNNENHPLYRFIKSRMATAYITLNGRLGAYISSICGDLGLKVPQDISILTFDNPASGIENMGDYSHISQSEGVMGKQAAEILLRMLNEDEVSEAGGYTKIIMKPELVVRQSTGELRK